mgnify:FL=1
MLAVKFTSDDLNERTPNKAISSIIFDACGDSELLQRLIQIYDVTTFTAGEGDLEKNNVASIITATGVMFSSGY